MDKVNLLMIKMFKWPLNLQKDVGNPPHQSEFDAIFGRFKKLMIMQFKDSQFWIQGISILALGQKYGLPLFVYDADKIASQFQLLKNAFKVDQIKFNYACKALSNISILRLMKSLGAGIDAVSIGEIKLSLAAGFEPFDIVYTPSSVSLGEYDEAIELGVRINVDNLEILSQISKKYPGHPLCVRINPHIMAGGNKKISVGHIDSKFGISIHQMPQLLDLIEANKINIEGVHMHTGSDILDVQVFLRATDILFAAAKNFTHLKYIDFGSGFKVKYKPEDIETDINLFGQEMSRKFRAFCQEIGRDLQLMFEPGKFLVSESGYFLAQTNVVKQTPSQLFAGLDTGFNHLIRPMFYESYHTIENASNPKANKKIYSVVGYICETDTFAWNRPISEIRAGDVLVFRNAGAYCFMMASNYNSRLRPPEVLIHDGKDYLIRKGEKYEDLVRHLVDPPIDF